jgi:hypothetical protein
MRPSVGTLCAPSAAATVLLWPIHRGNGREDT